MRGRSLWKEPPCSSLCAFCSHRVGAARRPSHVQRRFLQSSRPASRPPFAAAAVQEDDRNGELSQASGPNTIGWGRPGPLSANGPSGSTISWGRPANGHGIPPAGLAPNWGRPGTDPTSTIFTQRSPLAGHSSLPPNNSELLPHEQRARDLMLEKTREVKHKAADIHVHSGPGPESTRSGRPEYELRTEEQRLLVAKHAVAKQKALEEYQREKAALRGQGPTIRRLMGDRDSQAPQSQANSSTSGASDARNDSLPQWNQLRRRRNVTAQTDSSFRGSGFSEGRSRREEEAKLGRYTPLGSRSVFQPVASDSGTKTVTWRPLLNQETGFESRRDRLADDKISEKQTPEIRTTTDSEPVHSPPTFAVEELKSNLEEPRTPRVELEQQKITASKVPTRIASEHSSRKAADSDLPRGRGRDKAKRRQQFSEADDGVDPATLAAKRAELRKQRKLEKAAKKAAAPTPMLLPEYISVSNLAMALKVRLEDFMEKLDELGFAETTHDHILNSENAGLIAREYNFEPIIDQAESEDLKPRPKAEDQSLLPHRPPVVTIMGHVDHGKTTLLDWLRKSSVAATEHGGITQHIGAFSVPMPSGKVITFLDTPGHAAFLSMRQRGANVTDIVILVVAADDSVKPQTIEAINHAKAAKVPMIVAINKIDKDNTNVERVKQDLARQGVEVEDFGGDTQVVCVSGKTGQGMEELEEAVVTLSEILDMRAEIDGQAEGWVLEASIKSMGKVATVLVRRGTMRSGDFVVAGNTWARIRCLRNEAGVEITEAGPGTPVEIDGWRELPLAGDEVLQAPGESKAKSVVQYRLEREERDKMAEDMEAINDIRKVEQEKRAREKEAALLAAKNGDEDAEIEAARAEDAGGPKQVAFIVKGDVSGSVEAVIDSVSAIGNNEVRPRILRSGVGQLSEFDIEHAAAAKGHVINFNTTIEPNIVRLAKDAKVAIIDHNIIYRLVDDVKAKLSEQLPPLITCKVLGEAEIAQIFEITVKGRQQKSIAGCRVKNGVVSKTAKVRVLRGSEKIFDGSLASLKNRKQDAVEMRKGTECGMGFEDWYDFQVGDQVQAYEERREKRYL